MSIPVEVADLAKALQEFGAGYLLTTTGGNVKVVIRPERVRIEDSGASGPNRVPAMVERVVYVGPVIQMLVRLAFGQTIQAMVPNHGEGAVYAQGTPVVAHMSPEALRILEEGPGRGTREEPDASPQDRDSVPPVVSPTT